MKEELGLDHFEGRSWQGLHRHALMTMIAYDAFLQHRRLATARREKKNQRAAASRSDFRAQNIPMPVALPIRANDVIPILETVRP
jgi:SRSO17 transposase